MTSLTDRIAAVLADCYRDGIEIAHAPTAARHAAERVEAELQLTEETAPSMPHWKRLVTPYEQDMCTCTDDGPDPQCPDHASIAPDWTI